MAGILLTSRKTICCSRSLLRIINCLLRPFFLIFDVRTVDKMITLDHIFLNQNRRHHRDFHLHCVRFQFLMSACIKNTISRDVTLCNVLEIYRRFAKELYCHLQVGRLFVRNGATSHVIITLLLFCYLWFQNNNNNNDDDDDDNNNNR